MSTYLHLSNFDIVTEVYKRQQEAELFREKEFRAALRVQVHYSTVNASFWKIGLTVFTRTIFNRWSDIQKFFTNLKKTFFFDFES